MHNPDTRPNSALLCVARANSRAFALVWSAYVHQLRNEPETVKAHTGEALALAVEHGLADVRGWAAVLHAWAGEDPQAATAIIRESLAAQRGFGSEIARPHQLGMLADVLIRAGDYRQAAAALDEALGQAMRTGDRYYEPELHRLKGDVALMAHGDDPGGSAAAATHYHRAVECARRPGSRLLEQRAAASLVRS